MQLDLHVQELRDDLARIAAVGNESTAEAAELLAVALEPALARRLLEALAEAALELSAQLDDGRVDVRLGGVDPELVYVREEAAAGPPEPGDTASSARVSLRLPESLKLRLDTAAADQGVSVNTWLVQAIQRALAARPHSGGSRRQRLSGFGRT